MPPKREYIYHSLPVLAATFGVEWVQNFLRSQGSSFISEFFGVGEPGVFVGRRDFFYSSSYDATQVDRNYYPNPPREFMDLRHEWQSLPYEDRALIWEQYSHRGYSQANRLRIRNRIMAAYDDIDEYTEPASVVDSDVPPEVLQATMDEKYPDLGSNEIIVAASADEVMVDAEKKGRHGKRRATEMALRAGVEEVWIGPKGIKARKKRRAEAFAQEKLLRQAVQFGVTDPTTGPNSFNVAERIQEYAWVKSSSFSVGYYADQKQGEAAWSFQSPFFHHGAYQLRNIIGIDDTNLTDTRIARLAVLEARAQWHIRNNGFEPAELTVFALDARGDIQCAYVNDDGETFFPPPDDRMPACGRRRL